MEKVPCTVSFSVPNSGLPPNQGNQVKWGKLRYNQGKSGKKVLI